MEAPARRFSLGACILMISLLLLVVEAGKYSKDMNKTPHDISDTPFRMNKVNLLWEKAKKRLRPVRLSQLYAELKTHDVEELNAKKRKVDGYDESGDIEAAVRKKFIAIIDEYGLGEHFGSKDPNSNKLEENPPVYDTSPASIMRDKKLGKLWKKAEVSGFSDEELEQLKREFMHYQLKKEEYDTLKNEIDAIEEISDNSIDQFKSEGKDWKLAKEKHKKLKQKHIQVKERYENLEAMTRRGGKLPGDFTEPKVVDLWLQAIKANFSEHELNSLKEELTHFEHRLKKHDYYQEQVHLSAAGLAAGSKVNHDKMPVKHEDLEKKERDYARKMKKIHSDLKYRIEKAYKRHTEL